MGSPPRNFPLDILKLIAFIGVVGLHTVDPAGGVSTGLNVCARIGVPVFFAVSGYFAVGASVSVLWRRARRICVLLVFGLAFYAALSLVGLWGGDNAGFVEKMLDPSRIVNFLYFNYVPDAYHLWFLAALAFVYFAFIVYCSVSGSYRGLYCIAVALLTFRFSCSEVVPTIDPLSMELRTWLLMGVPTFALGVFVRSGESHFLRLSSKVFLVVAMLGFALAFMEYKSFGLQELYFGTLLSVFSLFCLCLKHPRLGEGGWLGKLSKEVGGDTIMVAYTVHLAVVYWVEMLLVHVSSSSLFPYALMGLTVLVSLISGILYQNAKTCFKNYLKNAQ